MLRHLCTHKPGYDHKRVDRHQQEKQQNLANLVRIDHIYLPRGYIYDYFELVVGSKCYF